MASITFLLRVFVLSFLITIAATAPEIRPTAFKQIERLAALPEGWTQEQTAPEPSTNIHFKLSIQDDTKRNELHETLFDVSTPGNPRYGKHLTRGELRGLLQPAPNVIASIVAWLAAGGVKDRDIQLKGDWIDLDTTVENAEKLLDTRFYYFRDEATNASKIGTWEYSVPESVAEYIRIIQPTTMFGRLMAPSAPEIKVKNRRSKAPGTGHDDPCAKQNTPHCLRKLYGLHNFIAEPRDDNKFGVSGYLEQHAQYEDLEMFLCEFAPYARGANFSVKLINGGVNIQSNPGGMSVEANLNIQYATALTYNTDVVFYSTGGRGQLILDRDQPSEIYNTNEPYLEQLQHLVDLLDDELPTVLITSYGETEQSVPERYAIVACDLFAQLGVRGVSVIFSSGNYGTGSSCRANDGTDKTRFNPTFPASCPFVTSVGTTAGINPERAMDSSSGGFSDRFERPKYQDKAVNWYLQSELGAQWDGLYNSTGRGFPDVAAQGDNYQIYNKGRVIAMGGTSASAPTFAAIVSNLNYVRLSQRKRPLGFLNPWLYSWGHRGFTDIIDGGSRGCSGFDRSTGRAGQFVPYASWNATKGWDPVTGIGTPNFKKLVKLMP